MQREEIIKLAEELGILIPTIDYQHPTHMRLISRLEKFATRVERDTLDKHIESIESQLALQRVSDLTKEIGQEL